MASVCVLAPGVRDVPRRDFGRARRGPCIRERVCSNLGRVARQGDRHDHIPSCRRVLATPRPTPAPRTTRPNFGTCTFGSAIAPFPATRASIPHCSRRHARPATPCWPRRRPRSAPALPALNETARAGELVLDCVLVEPFEWWLGWHRADAVETRWPGGVPPLVAPKRMISRAYLKILEALLWSELPISEGDHCIEIGSSPGGSCLGVARARLRRDRNRPRGDGSARARATELQAPARESERRQAQRVPRLPLARAWMPTSLRSTRSTRSRRS